VRRPAATKPQHRRHHFYKMWSDRQVAPAGRDHRDFSVTTMNSVCIPSLSRDAPLVTLHRCAVTTCAVERAPSARAEGNSASHCASNARAATADKPTNISHRQSTASAAAPSKFRNESQLTYWRWYFFSTCSRFSLALRFVSTTMTWSRLNSSWEIEDVRVTVPPKWRHSTSPANWTAHVFRTN